MEIVASPPEGPIMTTSPEQAPHEAALFRTIREWGITRGDHGVVGGVVEGLGDRIGMARVPARIITVVAAFILTGVVCLAYAAAWALLPDRRGNIIVQNFGRGVPNVGALIGIAILTLAGLGGVDQGSGVTFNNIPWSDTGSWGFGHVFVLIFAVLVPLLFVGGLVTLIVVLVKRSNNSPGGAPPFAGPPAPGAGAAEQGAGVTGADAEAAGMQAGGMQASGAATAPVYAAPPATPSSAPAAPGSPTPHAMPTHAHTYAPVPPAPPRRPRVPGPGRTFYLLALAWVALAAAAAVWMDRTDELAVHPLIAGYVIFVTGLGVILLAVSLAGRKLGFLGFVAISSLVPLLVIASNADEIRTAYAEDGGITRDGGISVSVNTEPEPAFDPTLTFSGLYSNVYFNGYCYESSWDDPGATSVQRLDLSAATAGTAGAATSETATTENPENTTTVDITAEVTYLSIARGTTVTLEGDENALATVVFADRGFICDLGPSADTYMQLTNADAPSITLVVKDDAYANTIVIQEVAS